MQKHQLSFSQAEYAKKKKTTRRELFLEKMEHVVPWARLVEVIEPYYPKGVGRGHPPIGIERMLRMYCLQQWYGLADEAVEDAVYDSQALAKFMGNDSSREGVPDATTLMGFRHLLEANDLTRAMLVEVNAMLLERGLLMTQGTLVDATLIAAPSSTKNIDHARDPEMHQTKKGNQWHFGMKAHIGVDRDSGLVHTVVSTAANVSDISQTPELLHGQETELWADAGYVGVDKREDMQAALIKNERRQTLKLHVAKRRSTITRPRVGRRRWRRPIKSSRRTCAQELSVTSGCKLTQGSDMKLIQTHFEKMAAFWVALISKEVFVEEKAGVRAVRKKSLASLKARIVERTRRTSGQKSCQRDRSAQPDIQRLVWQLQAGLRRDIQHVGCADTSSASRDAAKAAATRLRALASGPQTLDKCLLRASRPVRHAHGLDSSETLPMRKLPTGEP